ncbi:MAG TPA: ABC transporter substrate binding protein, partial [Streptosporangiaceae bacterium]|nr:ABC transporter substrate binding protein [Streptosporangiaceae bacterium]
AVLSNPDNPGLGPAYAQVERAAEALGMQAQLVNARGPGDLEAAFAAAAREQADSLIMLQDSVLYSYHRRVIDLAGRYRLPAVAGEQGFARDGGLLAYGTSAAGLYRRAAYYVDRILKGDRPADLPVEQPMAFDFVINLNTAQALGLTIPQQVLLQATEVLQ